MKIALKALSDQVIVITGVTSGIGLATARMAAHRGARLVLAARSEGALGQLVDEIKAQGGTAIAVAADVAVEADIAKIAAKAKDVFGGFDTWVNNAGTGIYGRVEDVSIEDMRRLFDVNYWGVVYGSREAARQLRQPEAAPSSTSAARCRSVRYLCRARIRPPNTPSRASPKHCGWS